MQRVSGHVPKRPVEQVRSSRARCRRRDSASAVVDASRPAGLRRWPRVVVACHRSEQVEAPCVRSGATDLVKYLPLLARNREQAASPEWRGFDPSTYRQGGWSCQSRRLRSRSTHRSLGCSMSSSHSDGSRVGARRSRLRWPRSWNGWPASDWRGRSPCSIPTRSGHSPRKAWLRRSSRGQITEGRGSLG